MNNSIQEEFIATVSHEMRTPLTSIRGFSQTLLSSWEKLDEENKKKFVKIIEEQSNRLINLVENILTVSKINTDKPLIRGVNVAIAIEKTIPLLAQKYKEHNIVTKFTKNLPLVSLDEEKFEQVMMNLIDNACKYSDKGKTVTITTAFADSENVLIKVKDEGVGIKQEDISKVFDKFVRLENHLTSKTQGNGLGLYITKNLINSMNGTVEVVSDETCGTEFIIKFPFYNQEEVLRCSQQS